MRRALGGLTRFIATPTVAKHRLFVWLTPETIPDHQLIVFARDDDFFFGVLHSRVHEVWALHQGTQLETRPRYTPTTTFETFPLPHPTGPQRQAIAAVAKEFDDRRRAVLAPAAPIAKDPRPMTLTRLYNERPTWLAQAHARIDAAVMEAYGWPSDLDDDAIRSKLLELNMVREAAVQAASSSESNDEE
jgi:type II restriction/modification system DNA methylase subunit YeeA